MAFWVIERHIHSHLHYWNSGALSKVDDPKCGGWTDIIDHAVQFHREGDGQVVLARVLDGVGCVAEHAMIAAD